MYYTHFFNFNFVCNFSLLYTGTYSVLECIFDLYVRLTSRAKSIKLLLLLEVPLLGLHMIEQSDSTCVLQSRSISRPNTFA